VTSAADILEALGVAAPEPAKPQLAASAARVLAVLPAAPDEVARATGLDAAQVAAALAELELAGLVAGGDGTYRPLQLGR
jgi:predicted Rossmann fold nucleotide-binding protein DprA/Smf involved in DNA uptake